MTKTLAQQNVPISIIIPTHNASFNFGGLLDSLKSQKVTPQQIIIVDSQSTDDTVKIANENGYQVISIKRIDFDHGTTRNLSVSNTKTEFVIFLTQDVVPADENMISELIKPLHADPNIAICYGRQLPKPNASPLERFWREFNYPPQSALKTKKDIPIMGLRTFFCSNCCSAIRRSTFDKLGGFKNNVIVNEDMLYAAKTIIAGYTVYYAADAKVYHSHSYSLFEICKRYFKIGRFFADNQWLLQHVALNRYGGEILNDGIKTFWRKRAPHYIPGFLLELAVKAITCKIGWYYQLLLHKKRI